MPNQLEIIKYTEVNEIVFSVSTFTYKLSHIHHDMELDLVLQGNFMVRTNDEFYEAKTGNILVFNPFKPHEFICTDGSCQILTIHIQKKFCESYFPAFRHIFFKYSNVTAYAPKDIADHLRQCTFNLGYNYYLEEFGFELRCYSDLNAITYLLIKGMPYIIPTEKDISLSGKYDIRFRRIIQYIETHYRQKLRLKDIADHEGLSPSYLSHLIKQHINMSFQEYVNMLRFEHAMQLLVQTDKKLIDICMESGFSESKYFNNIFAKNYSMKPKKFRKLAQNSWGSLVPDILRGSRIFYSKEECLAILRSHFHFSCDEKAKPIC